MPEQALPELTLRPDPRNEHDFNAVAVYRGAQRGGFLNRLQAPNVAVWLSTHDGASEVLRTNGRADAPRAYAKIFVRPKPQHIATWATLHRTRTSVDSCRRLVCSAPN